MNLKPTKFTGHFASPPCFAEQIFHDLTPGARARLKKIRLPRVFSKNDTVLAAGDLPRCIYILSSGQARLTVANGINNVTDLRLVKNDEMLGINEIFANSFCQMNVETITPCVFDCLNRSDLMQFLDREPAICFRLLNLFGTNLQESYNSFADSNF